MTIDEIVDALLDTPSLGSLTRRDIIAKLREQEALIKKLEGLQGINKSALHDKILEQESALKAADRLADETEDALASNDGRVSYVRQAIAEYRAARQGK